MNIQDNRSKIVKAIEVNDVVVINDHPYHICKTDEDHPDISLVSFVSGLPFVDDNHEGDFNHLIHVRHFLEKYYPNCWEIVKSKDVTITFE